MGKGVQCLMTVIVWCSLTGLADQHYKSTENKVYSEGPFRHRNKHESVLFAKIKKVNTDMVKSLGCPDQEYLSDSHGTIQLTEAEYNNDEDCQWTITLPHRYVKLEFTRLDVELCPQCRCDRVIVYDNDPSNPLAVLCGNLEHVQQHQFISVGPTITVKFHSDISETGAGFEAQWKMVWLPRDHPPGSVDQPCHGAYHSDSGTLRSPGFGTKYPNDLNCLWSITTASGQPIRVWFTVFQVEYCLSECVCDSVQLSLEPADNFLPAMCGLLYHDQLPSYIDVPSHRVFVHFTTDEGIAAMGFEMNWDVGTASYTVPPTQTDDQTTVPGEYTKKHIGFEIRWREKDYHTTTSATQTTTSATQTTTSDTQTTTSDTQTTTSDTQTTTSDMQTTTSDTQSSTSATPTTTSTTQTTTSATQTTTSATQATTSATQTTTSATETSTNPEDGISMPDGTVLQQQRERDYQTSQEVWSTDTSETAWSTDASSTVSPTHTDDQTTISVPGITCGETIYSNEGRLRYPDNPEGSDYLNKLHCRWTVYVDEPVLVSFEYLHVEDCEPKCDCDRLVIQTSDLDILSGPLCGDVTPDDVNILDDSFTVRFTTDYSIGDIGFEIWWREKEYHTSPSTTQTTTSATQTTTSATQTTTSATQTTTSDTQTTTSATPMDGIAMPGNCGQPSIKPTIPAGGHQEEAIPNSWPWHISVRNVNNTHLCSGSIVTNRVVLTALRCVYDRSPGDIYVMVSDHDLDSEEQAEVRYHVQGIHTYFNNTKRYSWSLMEVDVAILYLTSGVEFNTAVGAVCAVTWQPPAEGTHCILTGWIGHEGKLQQQKLVVSNADTCQIPEDGPLYTYICATFIKTATGKCFTDLGSPLVCDVDGKWTQYGVLTRGLGCAGIASMEFTATYLPLSRLIAQLYTDSIQGTLQGMIQASIQGITGQGTVQVIDSACSVWERPVKLDGNVGCITSPGYLEKETYPNLSNCEWKIMVPIGSEVTITFQHFHLEFEIQPGCHTDRLTLSSADVIRVLCATTYVPEDMTMAGPVTVQFESDDYSVGDQFERDHTNGFNLTYQINPIKPTGECGNPAVPPAFYRIEGGEEATPHSWPWMVSLQRPGGPNKHYCSASIIGSRWILTAAHCLTDNPPAQTLRVVLGEHNLNLDDGQVTMQVEEYYIHENYDPGTLDSDICLMKLTEHIDYTDNVSPVCLTRLHPYDQMCVVTGWTDTLNASHSSDILNQVHVPIIWHETCNDYMYDITANADDAMDHMVCAGYLDYTVLDSSSPWRVVSSPCQGDGSPLVFLVRNVWYLHGLTSWRYGCAEFHKAAVFARVSNFIGWIQIKTDDEVSTC